MNRDETTANTEALKPTRKKLISWRLAVVLVIAGAAFMAVDIQRFSITLLGTQAPVITAKADCGVVLTGAAGRVREGIALLSHKQVKKLIFSGVHQSSTLGDIFPEILFYPEIELENIILERRSGTTAGNAQQSLAVVEALQCQSILLITSDYHMYRAQKTFAQVFPPSIQIVPYSLASDRLHKRNSLWVDTRFWSTVFDEWVKFLFYKVFVY